MIRRVLLLIALVSLLATCALFRGVGSDGGAETAADDRQPTGADTALPLPVDAEPGRPGPDRFSIGGLVVPVPDGWTVYRDVAVGASVTATLRSDGAPGEIILGSLPGRAELSRSALVSFLLDQVFNEPAIDPGEYYQSLPDGSTYAGIPLRETGEVLRLRIMERSGAVVYLAARVGVDDSDLIATSSRVLLGSRTAEAGETVYRRREQGVNAMEIAGSGWLILDDRSGGVTMAYRSGTSRMLVTVSAAESETGPATGAVVPVWFGIDRLPARVERRSEDDWLHERYTVRAPLPLIIDMYAEPGDSSLASRPEIDELLQTGLWLELPR